MYVLSPNQTVKAFPYSISALKRDNPNISFPSNLSDTELAFWNVFSVVDRSAPPFDPATENCNQVDPTLENGEWVMTWQVTPATSEEIAQRLENKSAQVRTDRNQFLAECDWTQLPDSPLSDADKTLWNAYRQQLREVPEQVGFPWQVQWPVAPA